MEYSDEATDRFAAVEGQPFVEPEAGNAVQAKRDEGLNLPEPFDFDPDNMAELPDEQIHGLLYRKDVLSVSGPSKAGKTFALEELALAIATGGKWLGFQCEQGRVLIIDGELHRGVQERRLKAIQEYLGISDTEIKGMITIWPLRGYQQGLANLMPEIERRFADGGYALVILDPVYIFMDGEENSATDTKAFMWKLAELTRELGSSLAYVHHHSKGSQEGKASIDRMAGSGVHGRFDDANVDMIELPVKDEDRQALGLSSGDVALRVEVTKRNFVRVDPFEVAFHYPVHLLDDAGALTDLKPATAARKGGLAAGGIRRTKADEKWETAKRVLLHEFASRKIDRIRVGRALEITGYSQRNTLFNRVAQTPELYIFRPNNRETYITTFDPGGDDDDQLDD